MGGDRSFTDPRPEELDPDLLIVWMARHVDREELPRIAPSSGSTSRSGEALLDGARALGGIVCLQHPGFDVALKVGVDTATLYSVYLGRAELGGAMRARKLTLSGPRVLERAFGRWFAWSAFAPASRQADERRRAASRLADPERVRVERSLPPDPRAEVRSSRRTVRPADRDRHLSDAGRGRGRSGSARVRGDRGVDHSRRCGRCLSVRAFGRGAGARRRERRRGGLGAPREQNRPRPDPTRPAGGRGGPQLRAPSAPSSRKIGKRLDIDPLGGHRVLAGVAPGQQVPFASRSSPMATPVNDCPSVATSSSCLSLSVPMMPRSQGRTGRRWR